MAASPFASSETQHRAPTGAMLEFRIMTAGAGKSGSVRTVARPSRVGIWNRFSASDPGLLRLMAGLRTVVAVALALAVLGLRGADVAQLVPGATTAMVATFAIKEKQRREQARTLALGLPVAVLAMSLGALLSSHVVAGDVCFIALIFVAVYCRRYGDRGTALGLIGFQIYFISLFLGAGVADLPGLYATLAIAFACSAVARFAFVVETPERVLKRLRKAFRARVGQLVSAQTELLDADRDGVEEALDDVRLHTARLHESAMMIQSRLEEGTSDRTTASLLQRRIADAEIAAERLGLLILTARSAESADTLTLHLPHAPLPEPGDRLHAQDDTTATLRRDLDALRLLVTRPSSGEDGAGVAQLRNRLLGYRDEKNLPPPRRPCRMSSAASGRRPAPSSGCGWRSTDPRTSPTTPPRRPVPARNWTPRTSPSAPRRRNRTSRTPGVLTGPRPGLPYRSRWVRPWPSSAGSCSPRSGGTGRC